VRWIEKTDKEGESGILFAEGKVDYCLLESITPLEPTKLDLKIAVIKRTATTQNRAKGKVGKQKTFKREYLQLAVDDRERISTSCLAKYSRHLTSGLSSTGVGVAIKARCPTPHSTRGETRKRGWVEFGWIKPPVGVFLYLSVFGDMRCLCGYIGQLGL